MGLVRRLAAVKLEQSGLNRGDEAVDKRVVWIDRDRNRLDAAERCLGERLRRLQLEMARALRKEHEADIVGAGIDRRIYDLSRANAANFHLHRHLNCFLGRRGRRALG